MHDDEMSMIHFWRETVLLSSLLVTVHPGKRREEKDRDKDRERRRRSRSRSRRRSRSRGKKAKYLGNMKFRQSGKMWQENVNFQSVGARMAAGTSHLPEVFPCQLSVLIIFPFLSFGSLKLDA